MPNIIEIKKYPRFKNNFKITFDNESVIITDAETIVVFGLKKGLFVDEDNFNKILKHGNSNRIMSYALYLISHKYYSRKSLTDKLLEKGFIQKDIDKIILRFCELNYLNDELFAKNLAEYLKNKTKGPFYIKNELKAHNIDDSLISQILSEISEEDSPYLQIAGLIKKKYPKFNGKDANETRKIAMFFQRRGFSAEDIAKALREFKISINQD